VFYVSIKMGKKVKVGKSRKDKFYHLAKESGYRARSAFKLIQLNRKFGFLQDSRVVIDLCAAPGGWLQVAANFMPISSVILGIDLVPIKPIKNVTTFQADITTDHCRQLIKKELKTWKADVVLNDGAPNVGSAWVQDAFSQAQLALAAMKLASDHLKKGGWFITKVFRSKDYNALLWVFQQLFKKVHSTKPQASRNESAEIFVVCQGYLAPDKLDERFIDPRYVFKEIQQDSKIRLNILKPEKHVRQREGYPENNITLHTSVTARQFIESANSLDLLATSNKIDISDEDISQHPLTTPEIKICCNDIKVLGRSELKALFSWRKKIRKALKIEESKESDEVDMNEDGEEKSELEKQEEIDQMVIDLKDEENRDVKKKKKRIREQKKKLQSRLANKLSDAGGATGGEQEQDLFSLNLMKNKQDLDTIDRHEDIYLEKDESGDELEFESDEAASDSDVSTDNEYVYGADELYEKPPNKRDKAAMKNTEKKNKKKFSTDASENPLLVDMNDEDKSTTVVNKAKEWFQKDIFKEIEDEDKSDDEMDLIEQDDQFTKPPNKKRKEKATKKETFKQDDVLPKLEKGVESDVDSSDESGDDSDIDDRSISLGKQQQMKVDPKTKITKKDGFETVPQGYLGPEALALGTAMKTSLKRKRDIIDDSFNRYSFNDDNLPAWFMDDESRHTSRQIPVTREEVLYYKDRMREINARPIKKVIEAKAKKKSKMLRKLDRARKKAQGILDATDTSSKEKQDQIKGIYKKAGLLKQKKAETTYVVAKRGLANKKYKRPANVKGQYKVVDPRMKKDLKAMKTKEKTKGRKKMKKR